MIKLRYQRRAHRCACMAATDGAAALSEQSRKKAGRHAREKLPPPVERGVIYLGRIPHGFYEDEMKSYFSQFGTVTRLKLYRSKKTGRSRGYAFIEFEFPEVAAIAAESMNNYLMFDRLLKCHVVEPSDVRRNMLTPSNVGASQDRTQQDAQREHNRPRSVAQSQRRLSRLLSRERRKRRRLAELGIDYEFSGYRGVSDATAKTPTHITFTDEDCDDIITESDDIIESE